MKNYPFALASRKGKRSATATNVSFQVPDVLKPLLGNMNPPADGCLRRPRVDAKRTAWTGLDKATGCLLLRPTKEAQDCVHFRQSHGEVFAKRTVVIQR